MKVSKILAEESANVVQIEHNQFKTLDRLMQVALELTVETNGHDHIASVIGKLEAQGYFPSARILGVDGEPGSERTRSEPMVGGNRQFLQPVLPPESDP